jgi:membrane-bound metal-dependent hydrolase YbcI (DUF457 family)
MADFRTHMLTSTAVGVVYGLAGYRSGLSIQTSLIAGGLCSVSGMLPDLDSDSGRPLREATTLSAAVIPMLMVERFQRLGLDHETLVLIAAGLYIILRFGITEIFRRYTVHRGMWHSLPAAIVVGMLAYLVMASEDISIRLFKTMAVVLGFLSHLILDEIWSVDYRKGQYKFKQSFGTALKLWGNCRWANVSTYAKLAVLAFLIYEDQDFMDKFGTHDPDIPHTAQELWNNFLEAGNSWLR